MQRHGGNIFFFVTSPFRWFEARSQLDHKNASGEADRSEVDVTASRLLAPKAHWHVDGIPAGTVCTLLHHSILVVWN